MKEPNFGESGFGGTSDAGRVAGANSRPPSLTGIFVTGIGTDVGKTITSAILCEALQADYWKPIQAGDLKNTDTDKVRRLVTNSKTVFHTEAHRFKLAASPHLAAKAENKSIRLNQIKLPQTKNHLVIEGAGGLMVPLNQRTLMIDLIAHLKLPVVLVSRHYLGSINHTLLSIDALKALKIKLLGIIFNGNKDKHTEDIILKMSKVKLLGSIASHKEFNSKLVSEYARKILVR